MPRSPSHWDELQNDPTFLALFDEIMQKVHLDDDEQRAGELVTTILGADRWVPRDVPGIPGMHDLDVVTPDASRIAVEVTSHTDGNRAAFVNGLPHRNPIEAASLRFYWRVDVNVPVDQWEDNNSIRPLFNQINDELEQILEQVERDDLFDQVRFLGTGPGSRDEPPLCRRLRELSIVAAQPDESPEGGVIWIQPPHRDWFAFGANDIAEAASAHIEPNLHKLLAAKKQGAIEAHLFVWLHPGIERSPGASAAVLSATDPQRITAGIDLCGIDSVWVTSSGRHDFEEVHGHRSPVYRYDQSGWCKYTLVWKAASG